MKKKMVVLIITLCICVGIILVSIFYHFNKDFVILSKTSYNYPNKEIIHILSNGDIERSNIVDELTINGAPKSEFEKIGKLSSSELNNLKSIIDQLKQKELKKENYSQDYGLAIKIDDKDNSLYGAEYFEQEKVNELNDFVQKILKTLN